MVVTVQILQLWMHVYTNPVPEICRVCQPSRCRKKCTDFLLPIVGYQKPVSETGASVNSLILNDPLPRAVLHKALVGIRHT